MEVELSQWEEDVKSRRDSFYELNYYTTLQLLALRRELGRLKDASKAASISPEVLALLWSISTHVNPTHVIDAVNEVLLEAKMEPEPEPAPAMEVPSESPAEFEEGRADDTVETSSTRDESGDMETSALEETASTEQEQVFSEDDLNDEQRGYITTITSRLACSRKLVLKAFDILGTDRTRIEYEQWCGGNMDDYDEEASTDEESESESESDDSVSSDGEDEEFHYIGNTSEQVSLVGYIIVWHTEQGGGGGGRGSAKHLKLPSCIVKCGQLYTVDFCNINFQWCKYCIDPTKKNTSSPSSSQNKKPVPRIIKIERIAKELVDENHPDVIKLVKAGYCEKRSMDAIARYGTLEAAMDYMADNSDEEDDAEEPDLIRSTMRQFSREDSLPEFEMNW